MIQGKPDSVTNNEICYNVTELELWAVRSAMKYCFITARFTVNARSYRKSWSLSCYSWHLQNWFRHNSKRQKVEFASLFSLEWLRERRRKCYFWWILGRTDGYLSSRNVNKRKLLKIISLIVRRTVVAHRSFILRSPLSILCLALW